MEKSWGGFKTFLEGQQQKKKAINHKDARDTKGI